MGRPVVKVFQKIGFVTNKSKFTNLIAHRLKEIAPEVFDECIFMCSPKLTDLELIPIVMDEIVTLYPYNTENKVTVLASIFLLFSPYKIIQPDNKLPVGMRDLIAKSLGFNNPETVSMHSKHIDVYWKNPRFKEKVKQLADKIYKDLSEAGFLEQA